MLDSFEDYPSIHPQYRTSLSRLIRNNEKNDNNKQNISFRAIVRILIKISSAIGIKRWAIVHHSPFGFHFSKTL